MLFPRQGNNATPSILFCNILLHRMSLSNWLTVDFSFDFLIVISRRHFMHISTLALFVVVLIHHDHLRHAATAAPVHAALYWLVLSYRQLIYWEGFGLPPLSDFDTVPCCSNTHSRYFSTGRAFTLSVPRQAETLMIFSRHYGRIITAGFWWIWFPRYRSSSFASIRIKHSFIRKLLLYRIRIFRHADATDRLSRVFTVDAISVDAFSFISSILACFGRRLPLAVFLTS